MNTEWNGNDHAFSMPSAKISDKEFNYLFIYVLFIWKWIHLNRLYSIHNTLALFLIDHSSWCVILLSNNTKPLNAIHWIMQTVLFVNSSILLLLCRYIALSLQCGFSILTKPWYGNKTYPHFSFLDLYNTIVTYKSGNTKRLTSVK